MYLRELLRFSYKMYALHEKTRTTTAESSRDIAAALQEMWLGDAARGRRCGQWWASVRRERVAARGRGRSRRNRSSPGGIKRTNGDDDGDSGGRRCDADKAHNPEYEVDRCVADFLSCSSVATSGAEWSSMRSGTCICSRDRIKNRMSSKQPKCR